MASNWRLEIGHVCYPFGFWQHNIFDFQPFSRGYHRFQKWLNFGGKGFWKERKKVKSGIHTLDL